MGESLFADITTPRLTERYPDTSLIYNLVQGTGADVSQCQRNCETSNRLVEFARDLHGEINKKIGCVEESGDWEAYDVSAQAIDPLEELLICIVPVVVEEQDEYLTAAPSIELCKLPIQKWKKNRKLLRTGLENLRTSDKFKALIPAPNDNEDDILSAYVHDDRDFLSDLLSGIKTNASSIHQTKALLEKVIISFEGIRNLPSTARKFRSRRYVGPYARQTGSKLTKACGKQELSALSIQCAMIMYGATNIIAARSATPELLDRYHSDAVWNAAQRLVDEVFQGLKSRKFTVVDLEVEYEALEYGPLEISTFETLETYHRLLQIIDVIQVGRAY